MTNDIPTWYLDLVAAEMAKPADPSKLFDAIIADAFRQARAENEAWGQTLSVLESL